MKTDPNPLAQNELGRKITTWAERIEPHTNKILAVILIATVAIVGAMLFRRSGSAGATKAWTAFYECQTPSDYETFLEDYPSGPVTPWARLEAARQRMLEGYRTSLTNRADSVKALKKAKGHYEALFQEDPPAEIRERGLAGLAMVSEALCDGNTEPVIKAYDQLLKDFPETYYKRWAENRLEVLKKPETGEFYAWYAKQDPKPTDRPAPKDGRPLIPGTENLPRLDELLNPDIMKGSKLLPTDPKAPAGDAPKPTGDEKTPAADDKKPSAADAKPGEPAPPLPPKTGDEPKKEADAAGDKPADAPKKEDAPATKPAEEAKKDEAAAEKPAGEPKTEPAKPADEAKPESK